jgi:2-dehydro-3-deoxy-D-gluconate 5-dehydrogenase
MTNLFDLTGRTAIVTGSARGMGRAMALGLAEAGADLVLLDRDADGIEATAETIRALGREALPIAGDVTDIGHLDRVFATVDRERGRVDILGNVAGEARMGAAEDMTMEDIGATFHNLVISRYYTCQLAGWRMLARGKGSIISIGSIAGGVVSGADAIGLRDGDGGGHSNDAGAEHRVGWARRAGELHSAGPGVGGERAGAADGGGSVAAGDVPARDSEGAVWAADDIKGLAVLLASDASDWITGAAVPMDGGNLGMNGGGGLLGGIMERYGVGR